MKKGIFIIISLFILSAASFAFALNGTATDKQTAYVNFAVTPYSSLYVEATQNELEQMNKECCVAGGRIIKYMKYVGAQTAYEKLIGNTYEERMYAQQQQDYQDIVNRCGAQPIHLVNNKESNYCRLMKTFCNNDEDFLTKINCVCGPNKIKRINLGKAYCEPYGTQATIEKVSDEESAVVKELSSPTGGGSPKYDENGSYIGAESSNEINSV